jgi:dihydropteroate synthase
MMKRRRFLLWLPSRKLVLGERTLIMGVLNVTPDSFSDGGQFLDAERGVAHALAMERAGADILDVGGESTRPGSEGVPAEEELCRVVPVLRALRGKLRIPISIDTQKAEVAEAAMAEGAEMINDVSALRTDRRLAEVARRRGAALALMHMRGRPRTMQKQPFARSVMRDVTRGLREAVARARQARIRDSQILLDPGIGFGKSYAQNFEILARLPTLASLGFPLLVGPSRKAFLGATLAQALPPAKGVAQTLLSVPVSGKRPSRSRSVSAAGDPALVPPELRVWGTAATVAAAILGGAHIVRVHDVAEMAQVARIADRILQPK